MQVKKSSKAMMLQPIFVLLKLLKQFLYYFKDYNLSLLAFYQNSFK